MNTLFYNATILTMDSPTPDNTITTGCVGVQGRHIVMVSNDPERIETFIRETDDNLQRIDAHGKLLMPGLINTHCHIAMTLMRSYADDITLMTWLNDFIWPFESKLTAEQINIGMELGIAELLLGGVTSVVDMYFHQKSGVAIAQRMGIRALLGSNGFDATIDTMEEDIRQAKINCQGSTTVTVAVAPHAPYTVSSDNLQRCKALSQELDIPIMTHIAETLDEISMIDQRYNTTPVQHLNNLGLLSKRTIGAHCVHLSDEDIDLLSSSGTIVSHNPQSNMKIASGSAPIQKLYERGAICTIGTDGSCSNNDLDMWEEMRTASFQQKLITQDPCATPAYDILRMATTNGAHAMGLEGQLGIIREGAIADIILIDLQKPHLQPINNLVANLVYCAKASDVDTVMVDGKLLVENRVLLGVNLQELFERANSVVAQIKKECATT